MLTTVCPSCSTAFRVTWEQLKVRAGWVRCGQCHTVFNGTVSLNRLGEGEIDTFDEYSAAAPVSEAIPEAPRVPPETDSSLQWPPLNLEVGANDPASADSSHQVDDPPAASEPSTVPAPMQPASTSEHVKFESEPASLSHGNRPAFEFGPKTEAKGGWWWLPTAVLLLLFFLGQTLFYFRGAIALLLPEAKPYISELCAELGCEIPLPRRVELVSIETSDLQADPANPAVMVLMATLRNRAAFPQAFPALELTLTNDRDLPLARRVLLASDYLADKTEAFDGSSEKQVRLHVEAGALKASGYRLYLFYP